MTVHSRTTSASGSHAVPHEQSTETLIGFSKPQIYRKGGKRAFDLTFCILSAPIALLLVLVLAILVACDGGNPFYSQLRVGRGGRLYRMWKLRSMVIGADAKLDAHLAENAAARAEWEKNQKLKCDPRITPVGYFIRRVSLDELPQLWNVIKGDMSLVGPRPMLPEQEILYPGNAYYTLRPGITGSWQISDRNECEFSSRAAFDTAYGRDVSFGKDAQILFATTRVVMKATGY